MPVYQYQSLSHGQIRLIELFPGRDDEPLVGVLHPVALEDCDTSGNNDTRSFEALSYVWGSDARPYSLKTGVEGDLPLTASLYSFLLRLRCTDRSRILWADGICINQADVQEKEQQVQLMAEVYKRASKVVADLGEALPADSERLFHFIEQYWRIAICAGGHPALFGRLLSPQETAMFMGIPADNVDMGRAGEVLPPADDNIWKMVIGLFDSPWFQRLWIVQEFILARDITFYYGTSTLDWRSLFAVTVYYSDTLGTQFLTLSASEELQTHAGIALFTTMAFQRAFRHLQSTAAGVAFLDRLDLVTSMRKMRESRWVDLLQWYRLCDCTLERDRYYALLSLASDIEVAAHPELRPDYATPAAALNLRIGKFLIQQQPDGREAFMRAGLATQADHAAPSWMQSFERLRYERAGGGDALFELSALHSDYMAAGLDSQFLVTPVEGWEDVIAVQGYKVDDVLGLSKQISPQTVEESAMSVDNRVIEYVCGAFQIFSGRIEARHLAPAIVVDRECLEAMVTTMTAGTWDQTHTRDMSVLVLGLFLVLNSRRGQFDGFHDWPAVLVGILQSDYGYEEVLASDGAVAVSDDLLRHAVESFVGHIYLPFATGIKAAITREGPYANIPAVSEPDDEIWVISGCKLPVVLRRHAMRPGMHRLVGVCYAHSIMDGSVLARDGFAFGDVFIC
ncbi:heterokaryon incompatibility protein-domain-containing protein [Microdochium bolleyi]|uniref:Heterokaryon incompatibility protein-domain-containing protein n=1 Tax=Microdochium bolleyi TaxID=196109 RepID=A0A136IVQ6_9PEZI|nr:heterokaryon incompatibility protein-domain-containing protein [Microdochium bolleyi]